MQFIVIGAMFVMFGTFWAIAVEQRAFRYGTKIALLGVVIIIFGRNIYATEKAPKLCLPAVEKSENAKVIRAVCKIEY